MDTDVVTPFRPDGPPFAADSAEAEPDATVTTIDEVDRLLDEVEAALTRLDDGTYGVCRDCDGPIDDARLSERPTGLTCSSCDVGGSQSPPAADSTGPADAAAEERPSGPDPSPWSIEEFPGA